MNRDDQFDEAAKRFAVVARKYCSIVDSAPDLQKSELLSQIYTLLPQLIDQAIRLPEVELADGADGEPAEGPSRESLAASMTHDEWQKLYESLKDKLGDSDLYHMVFDATKDKEAIRGSLADDIADIYRDLKEGIVLTDQSDSSPRDMIWQWRLGFDSHWGEHALSALKAIYDIRSH